ncbi:helix-turn-helix domain-containing protein [Parasulfitobacter algicola]|uniref:Helix-turn-helix transcriptional regulator n=1 Tax=Parasulfitobacter algicola TaxID=2614809 RepID=A0ABX2IZ35_9RHOB|nr:helix-turn-helix transcriptional regulator [Sulfitobacter algicola]NSX55956.1 helix-turn-helix transcriptional regulator [Sulfitobacter algicola]
MDDAHLIMLMATLRTGICLFCASVLLTRRSDKILFRPLGLLFLCQGLTEVPGLAIPAPTTDNQFAVVHYFEVALMMPDLISPFLLWWYVWELTREDGHQAIPRKWQHFTPLTIALCLIALILFIPPSLLQSDVEFPGTLAPQVIAGILALLGLNLLMTGLVITYLILVIRRLARHQKRLKDIFASTENRELRWIWLIILWSVFYVLFDVTGFVSTFFDDAIPAGRAFWLDLLEEVTLIGLIWVIGIWGLRQRPAFALVQAPNQDRQPEVRQPKYENSALDDAQSSRIAKKIQWAMQNDLLYRNPNLSLFDLSKHIGASSHYVSQTLNTKLHATFFDYVNSWRIKDALKQLTTTDETVLMIAYDVGFNSRSSFYKAFKRETGKTPMQVKT